MTDREVFERWVLDRFNFETDEWLAALEAWQACAEHYEHVMRRVAVFAWMHSDGRGPQTEDIETIIARAKGEG